MTPQPPPHPQAADARPVTTRGFIAGLLVATAVLLGAMHLIEPAPAVAQAGQATGNRDVVACTAETGTGGDALYLLDIRAGRLTVLTYSPRDRGLVVRDSKLLGELTR